jgi:hypothetical protein
VIQADPTRWLPGGPMPANMFGGDTFVFGALEVKLGKRDDPDVRRLVVAYHAMLGELDGICAHLQQLAAQNLDELPWLVAGALWVEWGSGQLATDALRSSLDSLRASRSDFDSQLAARAQAASGAVADLLRIAQSILADRKAVVPRAP